MAIEARNLLVELLVEELPPKALKGLGDAFAAGLFLGLERRHFLTPTSARTMFASPRRLAVHVTAVLGESPQEELVEALLPASVALDEAGRPTPAFRKRADKTGRGSLVDAWPNAEDGPDRLYVASDGKTDRVYLRTLAAGQPLVRGLTDALDETVRALPVPKVMTYQLDDGWTNERFVRPVHGLVALHGSDPLDGAHALGLTAGRQTLGHRFEAARVPIELRSADSYEQQLADEGAVIAGFDARRADIERQLNEAAAREGLTPIDDPALLDEVTALVEWPNVLVCRFDESFLAVPQECLVLTMKANQKYFPLLDATGRLTNRFLVVSNIRPTDPSRVIEGNERVVRPRLADAKFFFDQDRKRTLESRLPLLDKVVYHGKLGTLGDRVERVRAIARAIGEQLGGPALAQQADRAAQLAKADLLTDMVGEFPELQGVMGCYYAKHDGEPDEVAFAIEDHYKPRFAGDALPRGTPGLVVALADKLETLVGLFGIGEKPSGDKDPFALRRHALGVIRLLIERELPLRLRTLIGAALGPFAGDAEPRIRAVEQFLQERLTGYLRDLGYSAREIAAVVEHRIDSLRSVPKRLEAVRQFAALPEAGSLAAANKRVSNILKKNTLAPAGTDTASADVDVSLLHEPAEKELFEALVRIAPRSNAAFERGDYIGSLAALAALRQPVDDFFDNVLVDAPDAALRANRLGLLGDLRTAMNQVADLSKLAA